MPASNRARIFEALLGCCRLRHVTVHLDALAQGAQGILVQRAARGDHVFVGRAEVFDLGLDLRQALADHGLSSPRALAS